MVTCKRKKDKTLARPSGILASETLPSDIETIRRQRGEHMRRIRLSVGFFVLLAPVCLAGDGYRVRHWLSRAELVSRSRYIFTASVIKADHHYSSRRAYGEDRRYIAATRYLVRLLAVHKSDSALWRAMGKESGPVWISRELDTLPGKWALIGEKYRNTVDEISLKPGTTVIVYAAAVSDLVIRYTGLDSIRFRKAMLKQVKTP